MKLSIIIPVYDEYPTVEKLISTVQTVETGMEKELVIVDDCSRDRTREILRTLKDRHANIQLLFHEKPAQRKLFLQEIFFS